MPVFSTLINSTESYQRRFDQMARAVLVYWVLKYVLLDGFRHIKARGLCGTANEIRNKIKSLVVRIMLAFPSNRAKLNSELAKTRAELKEKLAPSQYPDGVRLTTVRTLPETGRGREWLESEWENLKKLEKADVDNGRVSGAVYHVSISEDTFRAWTDWGVLKGGDKLNAVINEAMAKFVVTNPLHPDVFPGVRKMESEIVSMCLNLYAVKRFNCDCFLLTRIKVQRA